jgi:hypothetical protein
MRNNEMIDYELLHCMCKIAYRTGAQTTWEKLRTRFVLEYIHGYVAPPPGGVQDEQIHVSMQFCLNLQ